MGWITRELNPDDGTDLFVSIYKKNKKTRYEFGVQVKGSFWTISYKIGRRHGWNKCYKRETFIKLLPQGSFTCNSGNGVFKARLFIGPVLPRKTYDVQIEDQSFQISTRCNKRVIWKLIIWRKMVYM